MSSVCGAGRLPTAGLSKIDGTATALGPKAGSGIYFPPYPLVESTDMGHWQGLGLVHGVGIGYCVEGMATPGRWWVELILPPGLP